MYVNKMTNEQDKLLKKIKKIRILGEFLIAFGRHKIIFKQPNDEKHYTLNFLEEAIIDFHETIEGREKKYRRAEKIDLKRLSEVIIETMREELPDILEEIDISNPKYQHGKVFVFPEREVFEIATEHRKREIQIKMDKLVELMKSKFVPMEDLQDHDFKTAFLLKGGKEYALYRRSGKYFLLKLDDLEMLMNKILEKSKIGKIG